VHEPYVPVVEPGPLSLHWKVELDSVEENPKLGATLFVAPDGPESIAVFGGVVSTVQDQLSGVASVFASESVALTASLCSPSPSAAYDTPETHEDQTVVSMRHSNVASRPGSDDENENCAVVALVGDGGLLVMDVSGAVVSGAGANNADEVRKGS
jgi:hypothetical protein